MTPTPKMSTAEPYRWVPCIVLDARDVEGLLEALPQGSDLSARIRNTARKAEKLADRLNQIEHGGL